MTPDREAITRMQGEALAQLHAGQTAAVEAVRLWAEGIAKAAPAGPSQSGLPGIPTLAEQKAAADSAFAFARQVLETNRDFAHSLATLAAERAGAAGTGTFRLPALGVFGMAPAKVELPRIELGRLPGWPVTTIAEAAWQAAKVAASAAAGAVTAARSVAPSTSIATPATDSTARATDAGRASTKAAERATATPAAKASAGGSAAVQTPPTKPLAKTAAAKTAAKKTVAKKTTAPN